MPRQVRKMIFNIYNKEVEIRDKIISLYETACGEINKDIIEMFFISEEEVKSMQTIDIIDHVEKALLNEVRVMEYLSRPENIKRAIDFGKQLMEKGQ